MPQFDLRIFNSYKSPILYMKISTSGPFKCIFAEPNLEILFFFFLQVLEILQSADSANLFSPEVNQERKRHTDAVTTDLLGALLSVSHHDNKLTHTIRKAIDVAYINL